MHIAIPLNHVRPGVIVQYILFSRPSTPFFPIPCYHWRSRLLIRGRFLMTQRHPIKEEGSFAPLQHGRMVPAVVFPNESVIDPLGLWAQLQRCTPPFGI
ncbi:hypothetical protein AVEN_82931-1 [Araneus ventricosus]|uniref:Uncharacterized protein n=1 Tax=Araneus ventricosus TaxID=182803 RepID=A0A4Y2CWY8_ARAVE|nr:hypothetical protein AVEN_82931-1 [Araneus ventricosus]